MNYSDMHFHGPRSKKNRPVYTSEFPDHTFDGVRSGTSLFANADFVMLRLNGIYTHGSFSAIFYMGDNFCELHLLPCTQSPF